MIYEKNNFGILGYGYVGRATHLGLLKNVPVIVHDSLIGTEISDLEYCDTIFICIPTSTKQDIDIMVDNISVLISQNSNCTIVIRSTLPIDTCKDIENKLGIKIFYIPEFLRERFWEEDCQKRPLVVGHSGKEIPLWLGKEELIECSLNEAELIKMFSNNFASMRIAFANLFYDVSQSIGADYEKIKNSYFKIAHNQTYMEVPGHDGTRGFGGKCLPKDFDFMIDTLDSKDLDSKWFKHIRDLNTKWQKKF